MAHAADGDRLEIGSQKWMKLGAGGGTGDGIGGGGRRALVQACLKCQATKATTEFWKNSKTRTGFQLYCKACMKSMYSRGGVHHRGHVRQ